MVLFFTFFFFQSHSVVERTFLFLILSVDMQVTLARLVGSSFVYFGSDFQSNNGLVNLISHARCYKRALL